MRKLSTQCDELRKMAAAMSERGSAIGLDYGMGRGLAEAAQMMREAADTIISLRDRLQAVGETCELTALADVPFSADYEIEGYDSGSGKDYATLAECSKCGAYVIEPPAYHHVLTYDGDEVYQPYRYCPSCRREIKEVER